MKAKKFDCVRMKHLGAARRQSSIETAPGVKRGVSE
jgi:hypothetical protein